MPNVTDYRWTNRFSQFGHSARQTDLPCLHRFHTRCGSNIRLSEGRTIATRTASFAEGLIFSQEPLRPNELFMVEIVGSDFGWNGHLRIGITQTDPAKRTDCPRFALPDLVAEGTSWVYTLDRTEVDDELGNTLILPSCKFHKLLRDAPWGHRLNFDFLEARHSPAALRQLSGSRRSSYSDEFQARLIDTDTCVSSPCPIDAATLDGSRVGVFYSLEGLDLAFLYFVVNGECRGPFPFELQDGPLFVVCDVYGRTQTVKVVPLYEVPSLKSLSRDAVVAAVADVRELSLPLKIRQYLSYDTPSSYQSQF